jgi:hypothetical protein
MTMPAIEIGTAKTLTVTGDITTGNTALIGFYVNSTNAGTRVLKKGGTGGTALCGTITPAVGFHRFPCDAPGGLHATIAGTALNVTFFYQEG